MNNCRRLTRADRIRIARAINSVDANEIPDDIVGFGRAPFPLRFSKDPRFPRLKATPFVGSPAWREQYETKLARFARKAEPILLVILGILAVILLLELSFLKGLLA